MAQGNMKKKTQMPAGVKGKVQHKKGGLMKKGKRVIAPQKARRVEADQLKKGLTRAINVHIEEEITAKAHSCELKSLQVVKSQKPKAQHDKPK